jgi:hypothetical protein
VELSFLFPCDLAIHVLHLRLEHLSVDEKRDVEAEAGPLSVRAAYSFSRFRYVDYVVGTTSYAGNRIPGVPEHALSAVASLRHRGITLSGTADVASAMDVDDANSARADGRTILGLAVSNTVGLGGVRLSPLVAVQNLTGARSVGSVV